MPFYVQQSTFQVETQAGFECTPDPDTANRIYDQHIKNNTPVEFYKEGFKVKEYKPPNVIQ